ncbi:hypothetical protein DUNSADRAFT_3037 [Dunaliella salina]|uniref:F-box domain-containing protein n=1 Tax=Dunaliella salina TaxID=3046 RepID=A0ABQ7FVS5_DUNSA|nr:hypothetical protein DUNSADRAFT_3037 [Dunaliella salina]|eukprot:KAF5826456.1 hypothetical protein DUNSADRAFT_3037 [Dunaliella salina]
MGDNQVFPLLSLPPELWGLIFRNLETKEDRRNFTHACKAVHDNKDIKKQINTLVLAPENHRWHADSTAQLFTAQIHAFSGVHLRRLELRGMHEPGHYRGKACISVVTAAVRAATATHATKELLISDDHDEAWMSDEQLRDICTAAPQLSRLELDVTLCDYGDVSPLRSLRHLKHLTVKRTYNSDRMGLKGIPDVLRCCTQLESLELPHSKLEGLMEHSSLPRVTTVCCPSLVRLRLLGVVADTLLDVGWMLDHVFPNVRHLEVLCIQLLELHEDMADPDSHYADPGVLEATLQRIRLGASIFASGRVCLNEGKVLILLGTDFLTFDHEEPLGDDEATGPDYALMYLHALDALGSGGFFRTSSDVRCLCLANILVTSNLMTLCGRHFSNAHTLVFSPVAVYAKGDGLLMANCIASFCCLSHITVPFRKFARDDAGSEDLYAAALVACHQAHMAGRDVVFCVDAMKPFGLHAAPQLLPFLEQALAWYKNSVRGVSGGVVRIVLEKSDYSCLFDEISGGQLYL